jgi:hypothetical protein
MIGNSAFLNCENLVTITIPDSVTNIGTNAIFRLHTKTIRATKNSFAEEYAKKNKINFEAI